MKFVLCSCRLSVSLTGMADYVQGTIQHYSKWKSWRELFLIPYRKEHKYNKQRSRTSGFTIERTVTLDKLGKTKTADSEPTSSASTLQTESNSDERSDSNLPPSSKDAKSIKEKKLPEPTDKIHSEAYLYKEVYFAHSKTPRTNRPAHVKLRVGEVVKHREQGYYGVIVGWDERALVRDS